MLDNHRLNQYDRQEITKKFLTHTFEAEKDILRAKEMDLSIRARNNLLDKNVSIGGKVYKEYDLLEILPDHYSQESDNVYVNAAGYSLHLYFSGVSVDHSFGYYTTHENRITMKVPYLYSNRYDIKDAKLNSEIQSWAASLEKVKETSGRIHKKMNSFLVNIRTVKKMFEAMPELKDILGAEWLAEKPKNQLIVTANEILCEVANIRGEKREGCCNGEVIAL